MGGGFVLGVACVSSGARQWHHDQSLLQWQRCNLTLESRKWRLWAIKLEETVLTWQQITRCGAIWAYSFQCKETLTITLEPGWVLVFCRGIICIIYRFCSMTYISQGEGLNEASFFLREERKVWGGSKERGGKRKISEDKLSVKHLVVENLL